MAKREMIKAKQEKAFMFAPSILFDTKAFLLMALTCSGGYRSFDQTIWNLGCNSTVQSDKQQTQYAAKAWRQRVVVGY